MIVAKAHQADRIALRRCGRIDQNQGFQPCRPRHRAGAVVAGADADAQAGVRVSSQSHEHLPAQLVTIELSLEQLLRGRFQPCQMQFQPAHCAIADLQAGEVVVAVAGKADQGRRIGRATVHKGLGRRHHVPVLGIEAQGSAGARGSPFCSSSTETRSGERTKAICPSRGGRLMVMPRACRWAQVA